MSDEEDIFTFYKKKQKLRIPRTLIYNDVKQPNLYPTKLIDIMPEELQTVLIEENEINKKNDKQYNKIKKKDINIGATIHHQKVIINFD
tara:strand:+ start:129 stop:395 length:267 start_codon:yes stop_codon:yes gene_type:complete